MYEQGCRRRLVGLPLRLPRRRWRSASAEETILRNTLGLKNVVNSLLEAAQRAAARPGRRRGRTRRTTGARKTYSGALDLPRSSSTTHRANQLATSSQAPSDGASSFQAANNGRIVFRGSHDVAPAHPASAPGREPAAGGTCRRPDRSSTDPPCAYKLTEAQYNGARTDGPDGLATTSPSASPPTAGRSSRPPTGYVVPLRPARTGPHPAAPRRSGRRPLGRRAASVRATGGFTGPAARQCLRTWSRPGIA